jgi:hypothetical protein
MTYTSDDGQRNCPKRVEFYSKNQFEKLVHLVDFIIKIYHDARSRERQKKKKRIVVASLYVVLSPEDVGTLAKCGRIPPAVLVCCLPHAVVVFIYLLRLLKLASRITTEPS